jgi:hypothetical protein
VVLNNNHSGAIIAEITSVGDFVIEDDQMYLINIASVGQCAMASRGKYCAEFQVNGEPKEFGYASADQVPTYLIIDTKTGDERFYAKLKDAPQSDQEIFQNMLTR